ncbi:acetate/propionate family kinase [Odoribacter sp. Z80]|uniref:acetate/propionate family kinase n=1 Tax=Odoribacter sp. Z80 TaxID=2304575 RepID=UPI00137A815C|nr:acetate kinase [Odoribacter sp. Z80]NCE71530.1 acetate kinase [Odoribacter sp. Z80]
MNVLVLNCGSSSIKYQLLSMDAQPVILAKGIVEKIGLPCGNFTYKAEGRDKIAIEQPIADHSIGMDLILKTLVDPKLGVLSSLNEINAVGHRVAHGGEYFPESVKIDKEAKAKIKALGEIAPLHNPANLKGIETMEQLLPSVPQVAVFDTSFHQTLPKKAYIYGIPYEYYEKYGVRKYGFHGTSHKFVAEKACNLLGWDIRDKKIITCHLGNGASITAIDKGKSVDTSMGFTPVAGLVMGTRAGDLDLGALIYIAQKEKLDLNEINTLVNKKSGVQGISGVSSDFRELTTAWENGNERAQLALDVFAYHVKQYIGAYAAILNGVDLVIFTGGIGENDFYIREAVCENMEFLGIKLDKKINAVTRGADVTLSTPDAAIKVMTITTDEELVIAMETVRLSH